MMNDVVARLLRRLASFAAVAPAICSDAQAAEPESHDAKPQLADHHTGTISKLIFGRARAGQTMLASHRSHSSHSSHRSHSSHYSGSGGGGSSTPSVPRTPTTTAPVKAPVSNGATASSTLQRAPAPESTTKPPAPPPAVISAKQPGLSTNDQELARVLAKLPTVYSRWPREAKLVRPTKFNIQEGGKIVGLISLDAGTKVRIVEIKKEHAVVRVGTVEAVTPVQDTNIIELMGGPAAILQLPDETPAASENKNAAK